MPANLCLRLDVVDNTDPGYPEWPMSYSVQGFKCGSRAIVTRDDAKAARWRVHIMPPDDAPSTWATRFSHPEEALDALNAWVDRMEQLHATRALGRTG